MSEKSEKEHEELLQKLEPIIDHLSKKGYHYLIVAGKDGTCARYLEGRNSELKEMLVGMSENNECVNTILKETSKRLK